MSKELILTNGRFFNFDLFTIQPGNIRIKDDIITAIDPPDTQYSSDARKIDIDGKSVIPGFVDSHLHIESSMVSPVAFARRVIEHGTTGVFVDPHEIANVTGRKGIDLFLEQSTLAPIDIYVGIPSCVPATPLEPAGAEITLEDIQEYVDDRRIYGLAEMMNFPGIISGDGDARAKVEAVYEHGKLVDGHCPGLSGIDLQTYISNGHLDNTLRIMSDHESTTPEEVREKYAAGMWVMLRFGSASADMDRILPELIAEDHPLERILLCSDDVDPNALQDRGHVNRIVRRARDIIMEKSDMDLQQATLTATSLATEHPGKYYSKFMMLHGHPPFGKIAPGYKANLAVLESLESLAIDKVITSGDLVVDGGHYDGESSDYDYSGSLDSVHLKRPICPDDFRIPAEGDNSTKNVRIIQAEQGSLLTGSRVETMQVTEGELQANPEGDIIKIAVFERHKSTGKSSTGFVQGLGIKKGAVASTVAHDSHNLIVAGVNDLVMAQAGNFLTDHGGGMVVFGEDVTYLPLRIGGLMSTEDIATVARKYDQLQQAVYATGSKMEDLFMTLSFLALPVIPSLKITSNGLVDVDEFSIVPLVA